MKNTFYMLVGLPGSGRANVARQFTERGAVLVSQDMVKAELVGDGRQADMNSVLGEMKSQVMAALRSGRDVVYDSGSINSKKRMGFLKELGKLPCRKVCVICAVPFKSCLERSEAPADVLDRMYKSWHTPAYYEGWNQILIAYADGAQGSAGRPEAFAESLMDYPQDNPHHQETLGEHLKGVRDCLVSGGAAEGSNLAAAALIHDCGKLSTKTFFDRKGRKGGIAHFYSHELTGAYDAMFFDIPGKDAEDMLDISVLIMLHMQPFSWKDGNGNEKKKALWGDALYEQVMALHEADEMASTEAPL